jgi:recombination associated protein RdgC
MFKNVTAFKQSGIAPLDQLPLCAFKPCGPTEARSVGFVPPRGHANGALIETVAGVSVLKVCIESRVLPASVLRDRVALMAELVERETGRKPGAKRRRELKDEAMLELLPLAFTRQQHVWVMGTPEGWLLIDQTSGPVIDAVVSLLVKALPGLVIESALPVETNPTAAMRDWLLDGLAPRGFGIGREAVLCSQDETGASVRYSKHSLDGDHVQQHLLEGKRVKALALNHMDRVDFTLDECMRLRKVKPDLGVMQANDTDTDPFDANVVLLSSAIRGVYADLFEALRAPTQE